MRIFILLTSWRKIYQREGANNHAAKVSPQTEWILSRVQLALN